MATLTNQQINLTYPGLIKTIDSAPLDPTVLKQLSDGVGGSLPIELSQVQTSFLGTVDFASATVTGLQAGGLESGSGSDSMQSAAFLTTTAANAAGNFSLALGDGARAEATKTVAIGQQAECLTSDSIVIGNGCSTSSGPSVTIGRNASANGSVATAIGNSANVNASQSIGISGENCTVNATRSVVMGRQAQAMAGANHIAIGNFAQQKGGTASILLSSGLVGGAATYSDASVAITPGNYGANMPATADFGIVIGAASSNFERVQAANGVALGYDTQASAAGSVACGSGVVANIADTTSVKELETQVVGGGITMYSPNGTGYKLTVSDAGAPVFTAI